MKRRFSADSRRMRLLQGREDPEPWSLSRREGGMPPGEAVLSSGFMVGILG